jgi:hypothetical protein
VKRPHVIDLPEAPRRLLGAHGPLIVGVFSNAPQHVRRRGYELRSAGLLLSPARERDCAPALVGQSGHPTDDYGPEGSQVTDGELPFDQLHVLLRNTRSPGPFHPSCVTTTGRRELSCDIAYPQPQGIEGFGAVGVEIDAGGLPVAEVPFVAVGRGRTMRSE